MTIKFGATYTKPEIHGQIIVENTASTVDWQGIVENLLLAAGIMFLVMFGTAEMWASFVAAFIVALVAYR